MQMVEWNQETLVKTQGHRHTKRGDVIIGLENVSPFQHLTTISVAERVAKYRLYLRNKKTQKQKEREKQKHWDSFKALGTYS